MIQEVITVQNMSSPKIISLWNFTLIKNKTFTDAQFGILQIGMEDSEQTLSSYKDWNNLASLIFSSTSQYSSKTEFSWDYL